MKYRDVLEATFISRPNRFTALVRAGKTQLVCHVKNTGRCAELFVPGALVFLQPAANPARKTKFDLFAVRKGAMLINVDSAAPNRVFAEWVAQNGFGGQRVAAKPEVTVGRSRLDFLLQHTGGQTYVEVKGVTLERGGLALFPDAPTLRGVKHIEELVRCVRAGHGAAMVFIIQMRGVRGFAPNNETHPAFGAALRAAQKAGVQLLALDCDVRPDALAVHGPVPVRL